MTVHEWLHQTLSASGQVVALAKGGILQSSSEIVVPAMKPFVIHRLTATQPLLSREFATGVKGTWAQITVHDEPGSYDRIQELLFEIQVALVGHPLLVPNDLIVCCRWDGDGPQTPQDPKTGTILQFARFRVIHK